MDENKVLSEIKVLTREELEEDYMDLHAAFLATEKRVAQLERAMQDMDMIRAEAMEEERY